MFGVSSPDPTDIALSVVTVAVEDQRDQHLDSPPLETMDMAPAMDQDIMAPALDLVCITALVMDQVWVMDLV